MTVKITDCPMFWEPSVAFLRWAIVLILGSSTAFLTMLFIVAPEQMHTARGVGPVVLLLIATGALVLMLRRKIKASVYVLTIGLWAYTTGISLLLGGLNSIFVLIYPLVIMTAGWLLGSRAAVAFALLTATVCFGFFQAELLGLMPPRPSTSPALLWVVQSAVYILSALLITHLVRSYRRRLDEVRNLGSELVQRTAELQVREADLNRAQTIAHVGSWVYDLRLDTMHLSAETCRIYGLPEGTKGRRDSYLSRVHPEDRSTVDSAWQIALDGGKPFDNEHRILVGKAIRWVRQNAELEFDSDHKPLRSVGTTQDITERKLREDLINEHNVRLTIQRTELEVTLARIRRLEGLLSICMSCKKIRTESNSWQQLERYLGEHTDAVFSHGLCPECFERQMKLSD